MLYVSCLYSHWFLQGASSLDSVLHHAILNSLVRKRLMLSWPASTCGRPEATFRCRESWTSTSLPDIFFPGVLTKWKERTLNTKLSEEMLAWQPAGKRNRPGHVPERFILVKVLGFFYVPSNLSATCHVGVWKKDAKSQPPLRFPFRINEPTCWRFDAQKHHLRTDLTGLFKMGGLANPNPF